MEINSDGLIALLKQKVEEAGSQKGAAHKLGVSKQFLNRVLRQRDLPGKHILKELNLEAVTTTVYRKNET